MAQTKPVPEGFHTITPHLVVRDGEKAIEFYKKAFGAEELCRMPGPDGKGVMHCELKIGDSMLMLCDEMPQMERWVSPQSLKATTVAVHLYVNDADAAFDKAVKAKPSSVRGRVNLGVTLAQIGHPNEAIEQFRAALKYDPKNKNAHFNLGTQLLLKNNYEEAINHFQAVLEIDPKDLEAKRELAKALVQTGEVEKALDHLFKAVASAPGDELTLIELSSLLVRLERYKEALDLLDQANRRFPDRGLTAHALARLLAACPDVSMRDGERAVDLMAGEEAHVVLSDS